MADPTDGLIKVVESVPPWAGGVIMALVVSVLRIIFDGEDNWKKGVAEVGLCVALTVGIGSAIRAAGFDGYWDLAIGSAVGALGSQFVRRIAKNIIVKRVDK